MTSARETEHRRLPSAETGIHSLHSASDVTRTDRTPCQWQTAAAAVTVVVVAGGTADQMKSQFSLADSLCSCTRLVQQQQDSHSLPKQPTRVRLVFSHTGTC